MAVKVVKLVTGEDVVADVQESNDGVILNHPAQIFITPQGLGLVEYPPLPVRHDNSITVHKHCVLAQFIPDTQLLNAYNNRYGSGVVVAPASAIEKIKNV